MQRTNEEKYSTIIEKNTFYFYDDEFEERYESYINTLTETLFVLRNEIETRGLNKKIFEEMLCNRENGLRAILALTGFSNEYFKRLITVIRIVEDKELNRLTYRDKWAGKENPCDLQEWSDVKIAILLRENGFFRKGIVNLFFEGSTIPFLSNMIPLFELKKLSISKLKFEVPAMIDTLVRYKEKGSRSGKAPNNPETIIKNILDELNVGYEKGDLTELLKKEVVSKRTMDFIIPNKKKPRIIIESSFAVTTSSAQGDKSKTEGNINVLIRKYYKKAKFIGFIDGIGWFVRKGDLKRMVAAFDDVFTFHRTELNRFKDFLIEELK